MTVGDRLASVVPVALVPADVTGGLALSDAALWNQTADDWALFIAQGCAIGFRAPPDRLVATAAALPYEGGLGWISMVLVATELRHRGLATRLIDDCVRALHSRGVTPVLDATPAGAPVYRRIGFVAGFGLERWERTAAAPRAGPDAMPASQTDLRRAGLADLDTIVALDTAANGIGRRFLLEAFLRRPGTRAWLTNDVNGFAIAREGRRATQVGPLVAADPAAALALLAAAAAGRRRPVFLDLPAHRGDILAWLGQRGFVRQRAFTRMALGPAAALDCGERSFLLAGPEFG